MLVQAMLQHNTGTLEEAATTRSSTNSLDHV
jgi:hypothetical protein